MRVGRYEVKWLGWPVEGFFDHGTRLNGGGFMYGASPYSYFRIYKLMFKRYWL